MLRAAKVNNDGIVEDVVILDSLLEGYIECGTWIGVGMDINSPKPVDDLQDNNPLEKFKKFLEENQDVKNILNL